MSNAFLKPSPGEGGAPVLVRDPITKLPLAADGEMKPLSTYWLRRIRDRDVIVIDQAKPAREAAPAGAKSEKSDQRKRG